MKKNIFTLGLIVVMLLTIFRFALPAAASNIAFDISNGDKDDIFTHDKMLITQDVISTDGRLLENPIGDYAKFYYAFDDDYLYFYMEARNYYANNSYEGFSSLEFMIDLAPLQKYVSPYFPMEINAAEENGNKNGKFAFIFNADPALDGIKAMYGTSAAKLAAMDGNYYVSYKYNASTPSDSRFSVKFKIPRTVDGITIDPNRFLFNAVFHDANGMRHIPLNSNYPTYAGLLEVYYEPQEIPADGIVLDPCTKVGAAASEGDGVVNKEGKTALKTAYRPPAPGGMGESRVVNRFLSPDSTTAVGRFSCPIPIDRAIISFYMYIEPQDLAKFQQDGSYINLRFNSGGASYASDVNSYEIQRLTELKSGWNLYEIPAWQMKATGYGQSSVGSFSGIESWGLFFQTPSEDVEKALYISDLRIKEADIQNAGFRQWISDMDVYIAPNDYWAPIQFTDNNLFDPDNINESFFGPTIPYNKTFKADDGAILSDIHLDSVTKVQGKSSLAYIVSGGRARMEFVWLPQSGRTPSLYNLRPGNMVLIYSLWTDEPENTSISVSVAEMHGSTDYNMRKLNVTLKDGWNTIEVPIDRSLLNNGAGTSYLQSIRFTFSTTSKLGDPISVKYDNIYLANKYEIAANQKKAELESKLATLPQNLDSVDKDTLKSVADFCKTIGIESTMFLPAATAQRWEDVLALNAVLNPEDEISPQDQEAALTFLALLELSADKLRAGDAETIAEFAGDYEALSSVAKEYVDSHINDIYADLLDIIKGFSAPVSEETESTEDGDLPRTGEHRELSPLLILIPALGVLILMITLKRKVRAD